MKIIIGSTVFTASLYDNATANAFKALLPLVIDMEELNNNEKFVYLPDSLPAKAMCLCVLNNSLKVSLKLPAKVVMYHF